MIAQPSKKLFWALALVGYAAAIVYAAPSLVYPYGRDQAVFHYIAEAMQSGKWLYADVFDIKPPAIFAVYSVAQTLFGSGPEAIRILELLLVLCIGGSIGRWAGKREPWGALGALVLSAVYFSSFDYWDTAQVELWEGGALWIAFVLAESKERSTLRSIAFGVAIAVALLFKFPAALPAAVLIGIFIRGSKRRAHDALIAAAASIVVLGAVAAPFVIAGHGGALVEYFDAMGYYAHAHIDLPPPVFTLATGGGYLAAVALAGILARRHYALICTLLACIASVFMQRKLFSYHWGVLVPFVAACGLYGLHHFTKERPLRAFALVTTSALIGFVYSPRWVANPAVTWRSHSARAWGRLLGGGGELGDEYLGPFGFDADAQAAVAREIRRRARPGDALCVGHFEPVLYTTSGLSCPSRFPWEQFFTAEMSGPRAGAWRIAHDRLLAEARPAFRVIFAGDAVPAGYRRVAAVRHFVLLERERPDV